MKTKKKKASKVGERVTVGHVIAMAQNMSVFAQNLQDPAIRDGAQALINAIVPMQVSEITVALLDKHGAIFQKRLREVIEAQMAAANAIAAEIPLEDAPPSDQAEPADVVMVDSTIDST